MKIIELKIRDMGRIEAIEFHPDGGHVVLGGPNGAGKTSVLDAIAGAIGGARSRKRQSVRKGAGKGEVVADLGDLIVRWRGARTAATASRSRRRTARSCAAPKSASMRSSGSKSSKGA
jgi:DNA repair ATPase RecN